ncbi:MAG: DUF2339 domain-containing protein [Alphaproteobacteria bacterium]|nr:DUF2339 domain-containing protein [Rhodospirillaceae bacterium]MBT6202252.1 DUF2339 domain-containing protein [Rhodospirillaceae bacterium]MBT6511861.1 DUF2339 domain-containing protein [Rhodospirillaceae bacterium]MBT7648527.1 DUF2339 domain-containing protein [Rhodospirillaceae bacterium]MDG2481832.1 DUF2339 domain-containing protein [Alphaproteobacteria bacterium]
MAVADTSNTGADGENPSGAQPNDPVSADHGRGSRASSWETIITSRWMVWTGAVALVLGVTFLVKFSIDQDLFGPAARVASGLVLGVLLLGAGEWLRRRPLLQPLASVRPEYIPAAVAGAGLISLFGTLYAAHASFGMIGTIPAFLALSLVVAATIAFSLLHGRSFALFGTLAGCAVPALFPIPDPSPWGLFPYLTVLSAACLLLVRDRQWWWLGWITVSLALFWTLVWSASVDDSLDMMVAGGFLVVIAGFVVFTRRGLIPPPAHPTSFHGWLSGLFGLERFVLASLAGTSIIMLFIDGARSVWTGNHRARPWLHGNATRFGTQVSLAPGERIVRRPVCARFPDRVVA